MSFISFWKWKFIFEIKIHYIFCNQFFKIKIFRKNRHAEIDPFGEEEWENESKLNESFVKDAYEVKTIIIRIILLEKLD